MSSHFQDGTAINGELQLCYLVFELCNCSNSKLFVDIDKSALNNGISKEDYVTSTARIEYQSEYKLHRFYVEVWIPHAQQEHLVLHSDIWEANYFPTFELFLKSHLKRHDGYPAYYEHYYDLLQQMNSAR